MSPRVLLVDDEANIRRMVGALLQSDGFDTVEAPDGNAAMVRLVEDAPDVVLLDLMMPPGPDGLATLEQIRRRAPHIPVVMMSGKANLADAVRATKLGAFQFLEKPLTPEGVLVALRSALELGRTMAENKRLHEQLGHADPLVGTSAAMEALRGLIARVAPTESRVLITGATERRQGRFELADGGTLFLDEVGDLGPEAQAKLLRVLEGGVVERVGGERPFAVNVRVIAATNKDLPQAVRQAQFREDLWFRLNVLPIHIPPLRERAEDIAPLVRHFAERCAARLGRPVKFDAGAVPLLAAYSWPGNVRELANIVERMAILATAELITAADVAWVLPSDGTAPRPAADNGADAPWRDIALTETLDQYERELIAKALSASRGNVAEAARRLQTDRANLYRRMRRLGIEPPLKADL